MISRLRSSFSTRLGHAALAAHAHLAGGVAARLGTVIVGAFGGTVYLLRSFQGQFLSALSVELELATNNEAARAAVIAARGSVGRRRSSCSTFRPSRPCRKWSAKPARTSASSSARIRFPALVRVRFGKISLRGLDSLTATAKHWPEVSDVVYPRRLWADFDRLISRLAGRHRLCGPGRDAADDSARRSLSARAGPQPCGHVGILAAFGSVAGHDPPCAALAANPRRHHRRPRRDSPARTASAVSIPGCCCAPSPSRPPSTC